MNPKISGQTASEHTKVPKVLSEEEICDFRERLCEVAASQFADKGFAGVSMRTLADELSVSRMTPYRYFKDKAEILAAVRASGFRQLSDLTEAEMANKPTAIKRLDALADVYFNFALEHPDIYRLMFEFSQEDEAEHPELAFELGRLQSILIRASSIAVDAGVIKSDATVATQLFWAGMHGVVTLYLSGKLMLGASFSELAREMTHTLYRGMTNHD